ncbi:MAG TPA: methyltransferase domain-containing protein [Gaiellaceae bacterium]|nr:methyltransferase domain-containing protein [Gaiellaceae bacterium]
MEDEPRSAVQKAGTPPEHAFKYTQFQADPGSTHGKVVSLVPPATRVLEFGCATGYMSEVLKNRLGCTVTGVEIDPEAAALAEQHCDRVIVGDAEKIDYATELAGEEFDVVLFADVLEHLKKPGDVLRRIRPFIAENGVIIASIPNIAHGSVRLALLGGEFRYRDWGLLDDTHLRFFTRASIQDLFEETGFVVTHWVRQRLDVGETEISIPQVPDAVREWLASDPESTTYQFVLRALVSEPANQLRTLREELEELRHLRDASIQLEAAREELEELRPLREEIASLRAENEAVRRAHAVQGQRLVNERVAFAEGLAHVHAVVYGSRSWRLTAPLRVGTRLLSRLRGR